MNNEATIMISAIILTWNSARYIEDCLRCLAANAYNTGVELESIVVDGGSTDGTRELLHQLAKEIPGLQIIQLEKNMGTTISRNIAIRQSNGNYILILDSDARIQPNTLSGLQNALDTAQNAGIAAPKLVYPDGRVQPSCKHLPNLFVKICKFMPIGWMKRIGRQAELYPGYVYEIDFSEVIRVAHCISACWLVRRQALEEVGLLDEQIIYAPEDVDYCLRMWLKGWEVLYVPTATVVHHAQRVSHKNYRVAWRHMMGLFHYFRKHGYLFTRKSPYRRIEEICRTRGLIGPGFPS